ncbi:MAG TPA: class I SAM-dependent methyltransferase [Cyclobacteriaceae bacterium]|nr:class I SAM-dependent methyltransferase [Cyclobacteriaceae bacterium]
MRRALIIYTTKYKKGGELFQHVARTLAKEKTSAGLEVILQPTETKAEVKAVFNRLADENRKIDEFHFVGHSGMYGPMFGTIQYPEQFSPHEVRILRIPFSEKAEAYFHCCRSARWFAPYFSRVQHVTTYGYHWYTAFSKTRDKYTAVWSHEKLDNLYCFGCPGKKSHGLFASLKKYSGTMKAEPFRRFEDKADSVDTSYNPVAELYDQTFADIKVRRDELEWINKSLPNMAGKVVLDIGSGNGALLRELSPKIKSGIGIDASTRLVELATKWGSPKNNLTYHAVTSPAIPLEDQSVDVVISMLSFRYLDWDPIMKEIERVLRKDGKLIVVDMVTAPVKWTEIPQFLRDKLKEYISRLRNPQWHASLRRLVTHPAWAQMLQFNPIRAEHEMKWYLESRFPGRKVKVINTGYNSRILAFDSINMENIANINLTYP